MRHASLSVTLPSAPRAAALICVATLMAGCSSTSQRFAAPAPWSSAPQQHARAFGQQATPAPEVTGSIPPRGSVQSQALPPVGAQPAQAYAPQPSSNWTPPPSQLASPGGAQPSSNWTPPPSRVAAPAPSAAPHMPSRPLQAQSLNRPALAAVPVPPRPPAARPSATAERTERPERGAPAAWTVGAATPASHTVQSGDSVVSVARRYNVTPQALAAANQLGPSDRLRIGQTLVLPQPGQSVARQTPARQGDPATTASIAQPSTRPQPEAAAEPAPERQARPERPARQERPGRTEQARTEEPAAAQAEAEPPATPAQQREQAQRAAAPAPQRSAAEFRWPVRGRVVTNFGRQPGGGQSDGIAIAVPAGTPVKAAENGIVAYAGNELRGYGNLILIRHEGDWVTAYAHNSQLMVRRGDTVTRGQTIARAGQTGNVSQPTLLFEIRRGSTPVNPMNHLTGG